MKIQVINFKYAIPEDLYHLQQFKDLEILYINFNQLFIINEFNEFIEKFNESNLPIGLKYVFLKFGHVCIACSEDFDYNYTLKKIRIIKLPFNCKMRVIFHTSRKHNCIYNSEYSKCNKCFIYDENNEFREIKKRELYLNECNACHVHNKIYDLIELTKQSYHTAFEFKGVFRSLLDNYEDVNYYKLYYTPRYFKSHQFEQLLEIQKLIETCGKNNE